MKIAEIYNKYRIMPQLQLHMFRVAAVAKIIAENMMDILDIENIIAAELLHDMGNIIKFDLTLYPETLEPLGLEYWQQIQKEYIDKYGDDEHEATYAIAIELNVSERIFELINAVGFSKAEQRIRDGDFAKKICMYSDHRVSLTGVVSLKQRTSEARKRYLNNKKITHSVKDWKQFIRLTTASKKVEQQIFVKCKLKEDMLTNSLVNPIISQLQNFNLDNKL